jgi:hypothetical protein
LIIKWLLYRSIPRPHLGLKFFAIKLLDPAHIEKIRRKFNIDRGLIVQEVWNVYCCLFVYLRFFSWHHGVIITNWTLGLKRIACGETWNPNGRCYWMFWGRKHFYYSWGEHIIDLYKDSVEMRSPPLELQLCMKFTLELQLCNKKVYCVMSVLCQENDLLKVLSFLVTQFF